MRHRFARSSRTASHILGLARSCVFDYTRPLHWRGTAGPVRVRSVRVHAAMTRSQRPLCERPTSSIRGHSVSGQEPLLAGAMACSHECPGTRRGSAARCPAVDSRSYRTSLAEQCRKIPRRGRARRASLTRMAVVCLHPWRSRPCSPRVRVASPQAPLLSGAGLRTRRWK